MPCIPLAVSAVGKSLKLTSPRSPRIHPVQLPLQDGHRQEIQDRTHSNLHPISPPIESLPHNSNLKLLEPKSRRRDRCPHSRLPGRPLLFIDLLFLLHPAPSQEGAPHSSERPPHVQPLERLFEWPAGVGPAAACRCRIRIRLQHGVHG